MNTKTKEGARNKGRVPWNKGGLVNTGPDFIFMMTTSSCLLICPTKTQPCLLKKIELFSSEFSRMDVTKYALIEL